MSATLAIHLQLLLVSDALKPVLLAWTKDLSSTTAFLSGGFFLVAINMHFILVGFSAIRFVQHQSETSLRLCCKTLSTVSYTHLRAHETVVYLV